MRTVGAVVVWLVVWIVLVLCGGAGAQFPLSRTSLVRFEGAWGGPVPGHSAAADLTLARGRRVDRFQVEEARVLSGERSGPDVLSEAQGRRPAFRLRGPDTLLAQLDDAEPGGAVQLIGYVRLGSPDLSLTSVALPAAHD